MDIQFRTLNITDLKSLAECVVNTWQETYEGIFPKSFLEAFTVEKQLENSSRILSHPDNNARPIGANVNGQVVGYAHAGSPISVPQPLDTIYDSELYVLYLMKAFQGNGIGKQLFQKIKERLLFQGKSSLFCWVVSNNPSRTFYAHMGGDLLDINRFRNFGGQEIQEISFGWLNLS